LFSIPPLGCSTTTLWSHRPFGVSPMRFDIITIFPQLFEPFRAIGVLGKAVDREVVSVEAHDLRDWADNRWRQVDDEPYGGGAGMVLQAPPVLAAVRELEQGTEGPSRIILTSPRGRTLTQELAEELAGERHLVVLCGRYEGFDERIVDLLQPDEISLGDFILGGGELAAMALVEIVSRLIPGVVGDPESVAEDSFIKGLLDYPCYTRPAEVEGHAVPQVLVSGNHEAIRRWRLQKSVEATVTRRSDLVKQNWERYPEEVRCLIEELSPNFGDNSD
jgi:tRNA (guanine37-N1)-methyltransferase